jgi:hypothetical protein
MIVGHQAIMLTDEQIEAAAKEYMAWQFPGRHWDDAVPSMKEKFREGARRALTAAISAGLCGT